MPADSSRATRRDPLLIVNPAARGGRSAEAAALAEFGRSGFTPRLHRTTAPGHAAEIAAAHAGDGDVFVLGGDGTVMEVVGALVGRQNAVGVLPGGTGNQLARHLGIPLSVPRAVTALAHTRSVTLDLGRLADGRYFSLTAGIGLDAEMIAGTSLASKRRFGVGAYVASAARALPRMRPFLVRITADGQQFERSASLAMIANVGAIMDGSFGLGPGVTPDDGWLDLCVLSPLSVADGLRLAWRMARRDFRPDPQMLFVRAKFVRIEGIPGVPAQADGELLASSILEASVVPKAARFLAPGLVYDDIPATSYVPIYSHLAPSR
jgi:YegS/Rv2252/BmrU family lipid kinase